jgi:hypothetical protein
VQPTLNTPPRPRPEVTPIRGRSNSCRAVLARQIVVPTTKRTFRRTYHVPPLPRFILSGQARSVRGRRSTRLERHGFPRTAPAWLYRTRGKLHPTPINRRSAPIPLHARTSADNDHQAPPVKYRLLEPAAHAPWHALMRNHVGALVGTDDLGDLVLDLLTGSLAPTTYNKYGTGMRRFSVFCNEEGITPLEATAADMLRFTTWLARSGTIAGNSLQPYFSATNKFFRDHLKEPLTLGKLLTSRTRHAATTHHRPRHSRTNPCPHRTTDATLRPSTLPHANLVAGQPRTYQDFPRDSHGLH